MIHQCPQTDNSYVFYMQVIRLENLWPKQFLLIQIKMLNAPIYKHWFVFIVTITSPISRSSQCPTTG